MDRQPRGHGTVAIVAELWKAEGDAPARDGEAYGEVAG
jgi:hypothetical protein